VRARIAKGRALHGHTFLTQHVTNHPGVGLHEPMRTITTKDQWALVRGDAYRPLTPRELARGMGFSDDYRLPDVSRAHQVRGLGNAVPPPLGAAVLGTLLDSLG
jgi:DNA (cytosine-5)-methyltransferase 1